MVILAILLWLIIGSFIGWIAYIIAPTNVVQGSIADILVGATGAIIGGFIGLLLGLDRANLLGGSGMVLAVVGAVLLSIVMKLVVRPS